MTITIQLTEIPRNETVPSRVFTLPKAGGSFGSAFDCTIQLPDRSAQVAPLHGRFVANKTQMMVEAVNGASIKINGEPLASGRLTAIEDGTMLQVADYILLISQTESFESAQPNEIINENSPQRAHFSLEGLMMDDNDELQMKHNNRTVSDLQSSSITSEPEQEQKPHFASSGVFSDDPFADDPFNDDELNLQDTQTDSSEVKQNTVNASIEADDDFITEVDADLHADYTVDTQVYQTENQEKPALHASLHH